MTAPDRWTSEPVIAKSQNGHWTVFIPGSQRTKVFGTTNEDKQLAEAFVRDGKLSELRTF